MLSGAEILREYSKCLMNPIYAIETYLETFDKTQEGFVPFNLFPKQKEIIKAYKKHRFNIITKPRQAGVSTTTAAFLAVQVAFGDKDNPEAVLILANKQDMAQEFLAKVKDFLLQLPRWVWGAQYYGSPENESKSIFLTESKKELKLPNNCRVKAVATSKDALRGYTPTYLVMDEAAFIDNGAVVFGAALTALGTGGRATLISTPNGMDSLYYKTYNEAKKGRNNFNIIEMKWYEDPRYNKDLRWTKEIEVEGGENEVIEEPEQIFTKESYEERIKNGWKPTSSWYEDMCKGMNHDARMIAQELDVSFLGSGGNVIDDEWIQMQENLNVMEPKYKDGPDDEFWIWEEPQEGHKYIMGCLPPNEKVLTDDGLKNIQEVTLNDKLISENGDYVDIINKQIYPVVNEDIFEVQMDNTFRTTIFTKEHPILISKPNLKRNYKRNHDKYKFNERYWDFDFDFVRMEEVEVGDWVKVPNIYKKNTINNINEKWEINDNIRCDFEVESPLDNKDFWWLIGVWLGDGWLGHYNEHSYTISICFDKSHHEYIEKCESIIRNLLKRSPSFIDKGDTFEIVFGSKFLYHFILENFGQYSNGKKIVEWVKFIPNKYKQELIRGYFDSDGSWVKVDKNGKINSKISFVSINLELLESIQDIIFSLGIISSLNKLRDGKITEICGKECKQKETYNLTLSNNDSLELINMIYSEDDIKLKKFNIDEFTKINNRTIKSCHFDETKNYIYFRVKGIKKSKFTGNVYNFECDTHTFMCHHITTHNCDVSRGDGADASTIVIVDFTTMTQVMEYQGKVPPDLLAEIVAEYGELYEAHTVVDITGGMGVPTVLKLLEFKYPYLHYDKARVKVLGKQKDLENYVNEEDKVPGFNFNGVRLPLVAHLEYMVRTNQIKIRSKRLTEEMRTFVYKNGRPDHMDGYHDDLLMSLGMALFVLEHSFKKLQKLEGQAKAMLTSWVLQDNTKEKEDDRGGFVPRSQRNKKALPKPKFDSHTSKNMQDPNGEYLWLFSGMR